MSFSEWFKNPNVSRNVERVAQMASDNKILGAPFKFNELADPSLQTYLAMMTPPPIVSLIPCRQVFNPITDLDEESLRRLESGQASEEESAQALSSIMVSMQNSTGPDTRYFNLEPDPFNFQAHAKPMLSRVLSRLEGRVTIGSAIIPLTGWGGIAYWCNNISVSENASNDFGESMLAGLSKTVSGYMREAKELINYMGMTSEQAAAVNEQARRAQQQVTESVMSGDGFVSKLTNLVGTDNINFAQVWQDSSFGRSYSLEFKFQTPFGDSDSIYKEVLMPFTSMLAMALPKQTGPNSYGPPFYVKADCPGYFTIDCGAITSMSIVKAPDKDWNLNGLATGITVTIELIDLYPAISVSPTHAALASNYGTAMYLDNLAGLDYTDMGEGGSFTQGIASSVNNAINTPGALYEGAKASLSNSIDTFGGGAVR